MDLDSFSFEYQHLSHKAILRTKHNETGAEYHITVMNGDLEKLLYGHHIVQEKSGVFVFKNPGNEEVAKLQQCIAAALTHYLRVSPVL